MTHKYPPVSESIAGVPGLASEQARTEFSQYNLSHPAYLGEPLYNPYLAAEKAAARPAYTPPAPRRSSYSRPSYNDGGWRGEKSSNALDDSIDPDHHDIDPSFMPGFGLGTPSPFTPGWC